MSEENTETETPIKKTLTPPPVKKELSMSQFRAWLEGVEEMQDEDWHPSASQWKTIRAKFDLIVEAKAPVAAPIAIGPMPIAPAPAPMYREREWAAPPPIPEAEVSPAAKAIMSGKTPQELDTADGNYDSAFS